MVLVMPLQCFLLSIFYYCILFTCYTEFNFTHKIILYFDRLVPLLLLGVSIPEQAIQWISRYSCRRLVSRRLTVVILPWNSTTSTVLSKGYGLISRSPMFWGIIGSSTSHRFVHTHAHKYIHKYISTCNLLR